MKLFKKKEKEFYYSSEEIDKTEATYRVVIGKRSNGKTYNCIKKVIESYFKEGKPSAYIRRYADEIKPSFCGDLLNPHLDLIKKLSKGKFNNVSYRSNQFTLIYTDETGKTIDKAEKPVLYTAAINTWNKTKGQDRGEIKYLIYDEFMTRDGYLLNEFADFCNIISSFIRDREGTIIYMLANTVSKYCPYLDEMGLYHVEEQEQGTIELYSYNEAKLTVAVEYCLPSENTKNIEYFYAFDSPQLEMIKTGDWEEDSYRHINEIDFEIGEDTFKRKFLVRFGQKEVIGEIHKDKSNYLIFFHFKGNSNYSWKEKDIIYTDKPTTSLYQSNSFSIVKNPIHKQIRELMEFGHDFYSSNSVGEVVRNFILYGNKS